MLIALDILDELNKLQSSSSSRSCDETRRENIASTERSGQTSATQCDSASSTVTRLAAIVLRLEAFVINVSVIEVLQQRHDVQLRAERRRVLEPFYRRTIGWFVWWRTVNWINRRYGGIRHCCYNYTSTKRLWRVQHMRHWHSTRPIMLLGFISVNAWACLLYIRNFPSGLSVSSMRKVTDDNESV